MKYNEILLAQILGPILTCSTPSIAQAASVSDLLITEIMANPSAVSDANGEWFELFNPTNDSINLSGITLSDAVGNSSNNHTISSNSDLWLDSGNYFVMARNGTPLSNGGLTVDYAYSNFTLGNSSDQIIFSEGSNELLRLDYEAGFVANGASMELLSESMLASNYAASITPYGDGDFGSPGAAGTYAFSVQTSAVPLPNALWLFGSGLLGCIGIMRRKSVK